jgi:hypothetical protein
MDATSFLVVYVRRWAMRVGRLLSGGSLFVPHTCFSTFGFRDSPPLFILSEAAKGIRNTGDEAVRASFPTSNRASNIPVRRKRLSPGDSHLTKHGRVDMLKNAERI